jgi:hypothetical protein
MRVRRPEEKVVMEYKSRSHNDVVMIPNAKGSSSHPSADQISFMTTRIGNAVVISLIKPKRNFGGMIVLREKSEVTRLGGIRSK